jgi:hypothetical protein
VLGDRLTDDLSAVDQPPNMQWLESRVNSIDEMINIEEWVAEQFIELKRRGARDVRLLERTVWQIADDPANAENLFTFQWITADGRVQHREVRIQNVVSPAAM